MNNSASSELDRKQDARVRRFLLALPIYVIAALLLYLSSRDGLIGLTPALRAMTAMVVVNTLMFLALRSGLNLRLRDPSLT